jgi:hypothetical protein
MLIRVKLSLPCKRIEHIWNSFISVYMKGISSCSTLLTDIHYIDENRLLGSVNDCDVTNMYRMF